MGEQVELDGRLAVEYVGNVSEVTSRYARYPLRFMFLPCQGDLGAAWVFTITYGGGFVSGDKVAFSTSVGPDATCVLTTQASTKSYKKKSEHATAYQETRNTISTGGLLILAPDAVACFTNSRFRQLQRFHLEAGASLVFVDWVTCGRAHEFWDMDLYSNRTEIFLDGTPILVEDMRLEAGVANQMGKVSVFATVVIVGARALSALKPPAPMADVEEATQVVVATAELPGGVGFVTRLAGVGVEQITRILAKMLDPLNKDLGGNPYRSQ
ncbi:Urease accessory protein D [Hondaea fermentalgiana]|uniref:Urease accessory protein D n=1 Tax=Hondaea fermentalgiana TaxID=2315210 RepID=A0A2R5G868_9STRA|nr:Urease accessory protein D [Hondaea fermentalgiana]|eukprot:GBG27256.1 Urease accessory protein D [Hondaea fermentalgiana]